MGGTFGAFNKKLQALPIEAIEKDSISKVQGEAVRMNQIQLLYGEDNKGRSFAQYSNAKYSDEKFKLNTKAGFGNVDLKVSGDFHESIFTKKIHKQGHFGLRFWASDWKTPKLVSWYSENIFGLKQNNELEIKKDATHYFGQRIKQKLK